MQTPQWIRSAACTAAICMIFVPALATAQRGGRAGGGRSMGHVGGGGARPSMGGRPGGGMSRPSMSASRPQMSRPSPNISQPSFSNAGGRPANVSRPSLPSGGSRPSLGGAGGGVARPSTPSTARPSLPTAGTRPSIKPPGTLNPITRPGEGFDRPSFGGGDRPSFGNLDRPTTLPGAIDRPGTGGVFPGGERPGGGIVRPGGGDRPVIGGGGSTRPIRPGDGNIVIGGGNTVVGGGSNIGSGNWNNRPGWGISTRPGGDWWSQNHYWHDHWHDHCIPPYHGWYHGCWNNHWGYNWYAPIAWGAVGWGLGSWYGGGAYYNPYYVAGTAPAYDYSQPVVVNNYVASDADATGGATTTAQAQPPPADQQAVGQFNAGLASFKSSNYQQALTQFDAALRQLPKDPVVHEVRALALFALGQYPPAAAALNSLLATAPGMDWTTMSSLYGSVDDYTAQLRKLEGYCRSNPQDAPAYFVLAYHYLVIGQQDDAVAALKVVVAQQPKDATAKKMLDALAPPMQAVAATPTPATPAADAPQTDLAGTWRAKAGSSTIELTIGADSQFTWKATQQGQPPIELKGTLVATADTLVLDNPQQGSMVGAVKSTGADKWQFVLSGSPPGDEGISFERVKG